MYVLIANSCVLCVEVVASLDAPRVLVIRSPQTRVLFSGVHIFDSFGPGKTREMKGIAPKQRQTERERVSCFVGGL